MVHRIERARETLKEARVLAENGCWMGCLNRTYYASFYAVNALLLTHDLSSAKHTGVRSLFNANFVQPGLVSKESGQLFNALFSSRMEIDYDDLITIDETEVRIYLESAHRFLDEIENLTRQQLESQ